MVWSDWELSKFLRRYFESCSRSRIVCGLFYEEDARLSWQGWYWCSRSMLYILKLGQYLFVCCEFLWLLFVVFLPSSGNLGNIFGWFSRCVEVTHLNNNNKSIKIIIKIIIIIIIIWKIFTQKFIIVDGREIFLKNEMMCRGSQEFFWIFNAGRARHVRSEKLERTLLLECNGKT